MEHERGEFITAMYMQPEDQIVIRLSKELGLDWFVDSYAEILADRKSRISKIAARRNRKFSQPESVETKGKRWTSQKINIFVFSGKS